MPSENRSAVCVHSLMRQCGLVLILALAAGPVVAEEVIARVVSLQGEAVTGDSQTVRRGTALREGDRISTGEEARVRLRFIGGSLLTLGADTELEVVRYEPARNGDAQQAHFRVLKGVFLAVAEGVTPGESEYRIETPAASMGIRGTIVWGGYFIPGQADYVLFGGGPVEVSNDAGSVMLTEGGVGTSVQVDDAGRPVRAPDAPAAWAPGKVFEATTTIATPAGR